MIFIAAITTPPCSIAAPLTAAQVAAAARRGVEGRGGWQQLRLRGGVLKEAMEMEEEAPQQTPTQARTQTHMVDSDEGDSGEEEEEAEHWLVPAEKSLYDALLPALG